MTEIELLQEISLKLDVLNTLNAGLSVFFATYFLFKLIEWVRHFVAMWKRGNGFK